jgi:hypothetical protein
MLAANQSQQPPVASPQIKNAACRSWEEFEQG